MLNLLTNELKEIVGKMFEKYGLTEEVLRLSQLLDLLIEEEQEGNMSEINQKKFLNQLHITQEIVYNIIKKSDQEG